MRPPADLPSTLVALAEAFAGQARIAAPDFWDYVYRKRAPPPEVRAAIVEALYPRVRPADFLGLTARNTEYTMRTMNASEIEPPRKGPRRRSLGKHPFFAALDRMQREGKGVTLAEIAKEVKRHPNSVRSFCYPKDAASHRDIPRPIALYFKERLGVPLAAWDGIDDDG